MLFELIPGGFSYLTNQNNYNSNWKKLLGFRNMQKKIEKAKFLHYAFDGSGAVNTATEYKIEACLKFPT